LIVGFPWPYLGGSKRVVGLASHLAEFGWDPVILSAPLRTRPPRDLCVVETEYRGMVGLAARAVGLSEKYPLGEQLKERVRGLPPGIEAGLRRTFDWFREVVAYPDEHKRWRRCAVDAANEVIRQHKIEALISVWPVTSHLICHELKRTYGIPWIADLADLWSDNSAYPYGRIRRWFDRRLERRTLGTADVLTTSSEPLAERLGAIHGRTHVSAILIGFPPGIVNHPPAPLRSRFTITYTGVFYAQKRDPSPFFRALQGLVAAGRVDPEAIEVRVYGPDPGWVKQRIDECGLGTIVRQFPSVPYEECIDRQRESHVLLQVNWNDVNEKGVFSGKLLDYLAAARPVLAAGGSGNDEVVKAILAATGAGVYAVTVDEIERAVEGFYQEFLRSGHVRYAGDLRQVEGYSNRGMARAFSGLLDGLGR
jgi:hypothetical protein